MRSLLRPLIGLALLFALATLAPARQGPRHLQHGRPACTVAPLAHGAVSTPPLAPSLSQAPIAPTVVLASTQPTIPPVAVPTESRRYLRLRTLLL